ncbi:hypothetical protein HK101_002778 [Irineochytrium annulatum]|nr:hypothetical protein HK101_002778 [Irineochytrium annulatum]
MDVALGIVVVDSQQRCTFLNEYAAGLLKTAIKDELSGTSLDPDHLGQIGGVSQNGGDATDTSRSPSPRQGSDPDQETFLDWMLTRVHPNDASVVAALLVPPPPGTTEDDLPDLHRQARYRILEGTKSRCQTTCADAKMEAGGYIWVQGETSFRAATAADGSPDVHLIHIIADSHRFTKELPPADDDLPSTDDALTKELPTADDDVPTTDALDTALASVPTTVVHPPLPAEHLPPEPLSVTKLPFPTTIAAPATANAQQQQQYDDVSNVTHELADMLAHEIRNPLTGILGNLDLLQMGLDERRKSLLLLEECSLLCSETAGDPEEDERRVNELLDKLRLQLEEDEESLAAISACARHSQIVADDVLQLSAVSGKPAMAHHHFLQPPAPAEDPRVAMALAMNSFEAAASMPLFPCGASIHAYPSPFSVQPPPIPSYAPIPSPYDAPAAYKPYQPYQPPALPEPSLDSSPPAPPTTAGAFAAAGQARLRAERRTSSAVSYPGSVHSVTASGSNTGMGSLTAVRPAQRFSPHVVLEDVVRMMRARAQAKSVELRCSLPLHCVPGGDRDADAGVAKQGKDVSVDDGEGGRAGVGPLFGVRPFKGDPVKLRQVLINLVANGIHHTERGSVTIRLEEVLLDDEPIVRTSGGRDVYAGEDDNSVGGAVPTEGGHGAAGGPPKKKSRGLRIEVADTGVGMTREERGGLFRRFSQPTGSVTVTSTAPPPGAGGEMDYGRSDDKAAVRRMSDAPVHAPANRVSEVEGKSGGGGSGLGLMISKELVRSMGGRIVVNSMKGKGSTFSFTVKSCDDDDDEEVVMAPPAVVAPPAEKATAHMPPPEKKAHQVVEDVPASVPTSGVAAVGGMQVKCCLIVEDNLVNQKILQRFLHKFNLKTHVANDGLEALAALEVPAICNAVDVVFMDVTMPKMNGLECTREIRRRELIEGTVLQSRRARRRELALAAAEGKAGEEGGVAIPEGLVIVALSGNATEESVREGLEAGMDDYLCKPYRMEDICKICGIVLPVVREGRGSA